MWLLACWAHTAAEPAWAPEVSVSLVAVLRLLMVYKHSAMYCLRSLARMQGWALCLLVCVTGLSDCWVQVLL